MQLQGSETFAAPRELVWQGLNDPEVLKHCITGCEAFVRESPTLLRARIVARFGVVKLAVTGTVTQSAINPPESCHLVAQGEGGIAGFAMAEADIVLTALGPFECRLDYRMDAKIGGALAKFSASLVSSVMQKYATRFFARLAAAIAQ